LFIINSIITGTSENSQALVRVITNCDCNDAKIKRKITTKVTSQIHIKNTVAPMKLHCG